MPKKEIFNPWEAIEVGSSENIFIGIHVGRFLIFFLFGESFGLQIWYTCY